MAGGICDRSDSRPEPGRSGRAKSTRLLYGPARARNMQETKSACSKLHASGDLGGANLACDFGPPQTLPADNNWDTLLSFIC